MPENQKPEPGSNLNGLTEPMERRTFLKVAIGTLGAVYAGAVVIPFTAIWPRPSRKRPWKERSTRSPWTTPSSCLGTPP